MNVSSLKTFQGLSPSCFSAGSCMSCAKAGWALPVRWRKRDLSTSGSRYWLQW